MNHQLFVQSSNWQSRFRWAICQIHVLQRLKPESHIVRNALENLPKTLDETYERIFVAIPDEDRMLVHYALKWIYYSNELHGKNISCSILLQAIERSICDSNPQGRYCRFDEELLRELCGCLITVMPESKQCFNSSNERTTHTIRVVSFAHYTVWEFIDSTRILNSPAASFGVIKEKTNIDLTATIILEILQTHSENSWRPKNWQKLELHDMDVAMERYFSIYCMLSSILSLGRWGHDLSKQDDLRALAFDLLNPS